MEWTIRWFKKSSWTNIFLRMSDLIWNNESLICEELILNFIWKTTNWIWIIEKSILGKLKLIKFNINYKRKWIKIIKNTASRILSITFRNNFKLNIIIKWEQLWKRKKSLIDIIIKYLIKYWNIEYWFNID